MSVRILCTAALLLAALFTGLAHASNEPPCVDDPALILMLLLVYIGGVVAGTILTTITKRRA